MIVGCRSCKIEKFWYSVFDHTEVQDQLYCLVCHQMVIAYHYKGGRSIDSSYYECAQCYQYIIYLDEEGLIYQDNIYFNNGFYMLRAENRTAFLKFADKNTLHFDHEIFSINYVLPFISIEETFNRCNLLAAFS